MKKKKIVYDYDSEGVVEHLDKMCLLPVKVVGIVVLPNTSKHARAFLDIQAGPFLLLNCCLLGAPKDDPIDFTLALPGKRMGKTKRSEWRTLVQVDDRQIRWALHAAAVTHYCQVIDGDIEQIAMSQYGVSELLEE